MVIGMLSAKIVAVTGVPNWGVPDESSKMEPTAAIAATQEIAKNAPLFGVTASIVLAE